MAVAWADSGAEGWGGEEDVCDIMMGEARGTLRSPSGLRHKVLGSGFTQKDGNSALHVGQD